MRHYLIQARTFYDGLEFTIKAVCTTSNMREAEVLARATDFTRDNGNETRKIEEIKEISFSDFSVLKNYLLHIKAKPHRRNRENRNGNIQTNETLRNFLGNVDLSQEETTSVPL